MSLSDGIVELDMDEHPGVCLLMIRWTKIGQVNMWVTTSVKKANSSILFDIEESFPIFGNLSLACYSVSKPSSMIFSCCIFYTYFIIDIIDNVDSSIYLMLCCLKLIRHDNSLSIISKGGADKPG